MSRIEPDHPVWQDYRPLIESLDGDGFPGIRALNRLLPPNLENANGKTLEFVSASRLPGVEYERHIFETGQVPTREDDWHDLFNALVWCRLPHLKAAMNALHHSQLGSASHGRRGPVRDALTLLDESGALLISSSRELLDALARRDWRRAFVDLREAWPEQARVVVCGHALLEKFLAPYRSITAHVLLLHADLRGSVPPGRVDRMAARGLSGDNWLSSTAVLSPLPLMGLPGWYPGQDEDFYRDGAVFRPPREGLVFPVPLDVDLTAA